MPDDERTRRRLGDATKSRIDGLASGWSLDEPSAKRPPTEVPDELDDDELIEESAPDESRTKLPVPTPLPDPRDSEPVVIASKPPRPDSTLDRSLASLDIGESGPHVVSGKPARADNTLDRTLAGLDVRDSEPEILNARPTAIASTKPARADNTLDRTLAGLDVGESSPRIASDKPARKDNTLDRTLAGLEVNDSNPRIAPKIPTRPDSSLSKMLASLADNDTSNRAIASTKPARKDNTLDRTLSLLINDTSGLTPDPDAPKRNETSGSVEVTIDTETIDEAGYAGRGSVAESQRGLIDEAGYAGRGSVAESQRGLIDEAGYAGRGSVAESQRGLIDDESIPTRVADEPTEAVSEPPVHEQPRAKPRTVPPPPPGSAARREMEAAQNDVPRLQLGDVAPPKPPTKPPTKPPPIPQRAKTGSAAPLPPPRPVTSSQPPANSRPVRTTQQPLNPNDTAGVFVPPTRANPMMTGPVQQVTNPSASGGIRSGSTTNTNASGAFARPGSTTNAPNLTGPVQQVANPNASGGIRSGSTTNQPFANPNAGNPNASGAIRSGSTTNPNASGAFPRPGSTTNAPNLTGPVQVANPNASGALPRPGSTTNQPLANPNASGAFPRPGSTTSAPPSNGANGLPPLPRPKTASFNPNMTGPLPAIADGTPPHSRPPRQLTGPVPLGEFDDGQVSQPDGKLRVALHHATVQHHTADALLGIPPQPPTIIKETPIAVLLDETAAKLKIDSDKKPVDPSTVKFERADPTSQTGMIRLDATDEQRASQRRLPTVGTLRPTSMLRRKRGVMGDVRYVFTALVGLRSANKEVADLDAKQAVRQTSRKHHLVTLGRTAITADGLDHPALGPSRDALQKVEDERSKHAGAVAAADAELERVRRDREAKAKTYAADSAKAGQELAEVAKKLEPLEKQAAAIKKRGAQLRDQLRAIAKKISDTEQLITSVKSEKMDRASIAADIATLKADQKAVQRDEPVIAAELAEIEPQIASLVAQKTELETAQADRQKAEDADKGRTMELFDAIGAKRKVVERAMAEAETKRDGILFELGERLYVDRPKLLTPQLAPIDEIDLDVGASDRRLMELREIISNIDRWKIARGAGVLLLATAIIGAFTIWVLSRVL
ncbi:MAG: hypothetical protein QM831_42235 [Kofleriaceae bacterium]